MALYNTCFVLNLLLANNMADTDIFICVPLLVQGECVSKIVFLFQIINLSKYLLLFLQY